MMGTGSPAGTEQRPARRSDLSCLVDWVAMPRTIVRRDGLSAKKTLPNNLGPGRGRAASWCSWSPGVREAVHRRKIRLNIDEGRAVDAVDATNHECGAVDFDKFDGRERDRIGAYRRTQGKRAAWVTQMGWHLLDKVASGLVHPIKQVYVAVVRKVLQAERVARLEFDLANGARLSTVL